MTRAAVLGGPMWLLLILANVSASLAQTTSPPQMKHREEPGPHNLNLDVVNVEVP